MNKPLRFKTVQELKDHFDQCFELARQAKIKKFKRRYRKFHRKIMLKRLRKEVPLWFFFKGIKAHF